MNHSKPSPSARLVLITPMIGEGPNIAALLSAAYDAGDVASVIARFSPASEGELSARANPLRSGAQERNVAFLLQDHAALAAKIGADGGHFSDPEVFRAGMAILKPALIAGAGGLAERHDAMLAAEQGADYVMFGEPDAAGKGPAAEAIVERVSWWAEIFQIPCVAYAARLDDVSRLAHAGADFIALNDGLWCDPARVKTAIAEAIARLSIPEHAG